METDRLTVRGWRDHPVPNELVRAGPPSERLAILLPGYGYSREMPVFYYTESLLLDVGIDVLALDYRYSEREDYMAASEKERLEWLLADTSAAFDAVVCLDRYRSITLVGKSLGTIAMADLLDREDATAIDRLIWLTPLLGIPAIVEAIARSSSKSLIAIGSIDPRYDEKLLAKWKQDDNMTIVDVPGADHSLDLPEDIAGSLDALALVMSAIAAFMK